MINESTNDKMYSILDKGRDDVLSNHILQKIIADIYGIISTECSVWSMEGKCLAVSNGDGSEVKAENWRKDEYGMEGSIKEELRMYAGISPDEEQIFDFAWYLHSNSAADANHIAAIFEEDNCGMKESGVELISYGLFYQ